MRVRDPASGQALSGNSERHKTQSRCEWYGYALRPYFLCHYTEDRHIFAVRERINRGVPEGAYLNVEVTEHIKQVLICT